MANQEKQKDKVKDIQDGVIVLENAGSYTLGENVKSFISNLSLGDEVEYKLYNDMVVFVKKLEDEKEDKEKGEQIERNSSNYFKELNKIKAKVEQKNGLNYISWSDGWQKLKEAHPEANYNIYTTDKGFPAFISEYGVFVKVGVFIGNIEHVVFQPVFDNKMQAVKKENLDTMKINKTIQRALAKAIAMHGVGLYVYRGEDFPKDEK